MAEDTSKNNQTTGRDLEDTQTTGRDPEDTQSERTFTKSEVNAIVVDRLARDREKYKDYEELKKKAEKYDEYEEANKTELQKEKERADALEKKVNALERANEIKSVRDKVAKETGVPAHLLYGDDEASCRTQAKALVDYKKDGTYPNVKDGGESHNTMSKEEILKIKDPIKRTKAIQNNIELFNK